MLVNNDASMLDSSQIVSRASTLVGCMIDGQTMRITDGKEE